MISSGSFRRKKIKDMTFKFLINTDIEENGCGLEIIYFSCIKQIEDSSSFFTTYSLWCSSFYPPLFPFLLTLMDTLPVQGYLTSLTIATCILNVPSSLAELRYSGHQHHHYSGLLDSSSILIMLDWWIQTLSRLSLCDNCGGLKRP